MTLEKRRAIGEISRLFSYNEQEGKTSRKVTVGGLCQKNCRLQF